MTAYFISGNRYQQGLQVELRTYGWKLHLPPLGQAAEAGRSGGTALAKASHFLHWYTLTFLESVWDQPDPIIRRLAKNPAAKIHRRVAEVPK